MKSKNNSNTALHLMFQLLVISGITLNAPQLLAQEKSPTEVHSEISGIFSEMGMEMSRKLVELRNSPMDKQKQFFMHVHKDVGRVSDLAAKMMGMEALFAIIQDSRKDLAVETMYLHYDDAADALEGWINTTQKIVEENPELDGYYRKEAAEAMRVYLINVVRPRLTVFVNAKERIEANR